MKLYSYSPFYSYMKKGDNEQVAYPPFYSYEKQNNKIETDICWPLYINYKSEVVNFWRFLLLYAKYDKNDVQTAGGVFPFAFWGKKKDNQSYLGIFPFYGDLEDIGGYNKIDFYGFPFYLRMEQDKGISTSYFWPFHSDFKGTEREKSRILPFYAKNHKYNDYIIESYAWPFWNSFKSLKKDSTDYGWMSWPFLGYNQHKDIQEWNSFWPFVKISERGENGKLGSGFHCPWPFVQYEDNMQPNKYKFYLWPFWGERIAQDVYYEFIGWPFYSYKNEIFETERIESFYLLPYWSNYKYDKNDNVKKVYKHFWPFYSSFSENEVYEFRAFDFWLGKTTNVVDRNWGHLFTFYEYVKNGDQEKTDILWGVYCTDRNMNGHKSSFKFFPFYSEFEFYEPIDNSANYATNENSYLCGFIKNINYSNDTTKTKILWCIEF